MKLKEVFVLKKWLFQQYNASFCFTGIPTNTPSPKNDNLLSRHAGFSHVAVLKQAV